MKTNMIYQGKAFNVLKQFPDQSINTCVTSPPYWGHRDYNVEGQLGLENTPEEYVERLVGIFAEVKRVLKDDGTLWLNLGDSYAGSGGYHAEHHKNDTGFQAERNTEKGAGVTGTKSTGNLKPKDLVGIPWRVAFALQDDGWYLRNDIIWHKPNPMPESVTDRCTTSHEHIFLLSKSKQYYYDQDAIKEPSNEAGKTISLGDKSFSKGQSEGMNREPTGNAKNDTYEVKDKRNKRDVWKLPTQPFSDAHFAVYPPDLIRPCVKAGCPEDGVVLDPFFGAGTTGLVAKELSRNYVGIELNEDYIEMAQDRIKEVQKELL